MDKTQKSATVAMKREQYRVEIRADKLAKDLFLKRQKFSDALPGISTLNSQKIKELSLQPFDGRIVEALRKLRMIICDEMGSDLLKTEVFASEFHKHLIAFLDPRYYKNQELLGEVLWILINLACVDDEEKLKLLFKEKLVSRLISLIKSDENSELIDDIIWCLSNMINISEEAKHDVMNEGILELSLKRMNSAKTGIDYVRVKNFVILYLRCTQAKPLIKYDQIKKFLPIVINLCKAIKENDIIYSSLIAISNVFVNYSDGLEETIHLFLSLKGHILAKEIMDDRNTSKIFIATLLKIVGSVANGTEHAVKALLDIGMLKTLNNLIIHSSLKVRHFTIWTISNILISNEAIAEQVFSFEDLFEKILKLLITDEEIVKYEAFYCVNHLLTFKKTKHVDFLLERNIIKLIIEVLKNTESSKMIILVLEILEKFLAFEEHPNKNYRIILLKMLEESGGIVKLDELQHHPDDAVYKKLEVLLKKFFD